MWIKYKTRCGISILLSVCLYIFIHNVYQSILCSTTVSFLLSVKLKPPIGCIKYYDIVASTASQLALPLNLSMYFLSGSDGQGIGLSVRDSGLHFCLTHKCSYIIFVIK